MAQRIQIRRDTAANFTSANPILAQGEFGYETNTKLMKIGDGTTAWTSLAYLILNSSAAPTFSAYLPTAAQSVTTATWTKATLSAEEFDTTAAFDSATNYRFTPLVAGYYQVNGRIGAIGTSISRFTAAIYKNGGIFKRGMDVTNSSASTGGANVGALIYFNGTTDYVELYGNLTAASPQFDFGADQTYLQASLITRA